MRVNLTIDLSSAPLAQHVVALREALSRLLSDPRSHPHRAVAGAPDRIERSCIVSTPEKKLEAFAARRPPDNVDHRSLRSAKKERPFTAAVRTLRRDCVMRRLVARVEHSHAQYTIAWAPTSAVRTTAAGRY